jgi:hypothetical protein
MPHTPYSLQDDGKAIMVAKMDATANDIDHEKAQV